MGKVNDEMQTRLNKIEKKLNAINKIFVRMRYDSQGRVLFHKEDLKKLRKP